MTKLNELIIKFLETKKKAYLYVFFSFALFTAVSMVNHDQFIVLALCSLLNGYIMYHIHTLLDAALKKSSEYRTILDSYNNMVLIIDNNKVINANSKCLKFFDIPYDLREQDLHSQMMDSAVSHILNSKVDHNIEIIDQTGNKKIFSVHPKKLSDVDDNKYIVELSDITEHINEKNKLENQAFTDPLTKLYNRRFFDEYLTKKFKSVRKTDVMSFILFDIDNFKSINDAYGHQVGDDVLVFLSTLIKNHIRETDILCRWGGEEFLLITNTDKVTATKIVENLRMMIDTKSYAHDTIPHFTCSFGIAETNQNTPYNETIEEADKMLYKSKRGGKNMLSSS